MIAVTDSPCRGHFHTVRHVLDVKGIRAAGRRRNPGSNNLDSAKERGGPESTRWMHAVCQGRYEENGYTDGTLREGFGYVFIFVLWLASVDLPPVSEGYDIMIPSLIEVTLDHIRDKPKADTVNTWVMWATAQHMDLREPSPYSRNIPA